MMQSSIKSTWLAAAVAIAAVSASPIDIASPVELAERAAASNYLFTFGDSYSQTGFNPGGTQPSCSNPLGNPAFPGSTTDNGANWIEYIVETAPASACLLNWNYAFGGATVNKNIVPAYSTGVLDMIQQTSELKSGVGLKPSPYDWTTSNTVAAVWFGVNDVGNSYDEANATAIVIADLTSYFYELSDMYSEVGVRKFLLLTLPPIDRAPTYLTHSAASLKTLRAQISNWNSQLKSLAQTWSAAHNGSEVMFLDTHPIFETILNNPTEYGAPNATCSNTDGTSCLWWNPLHPGQAIQKAVGAAAYKKLFGTGGFGL